MRTKKGKMLCIIIFLLICIILNGLLKWLFIPPNTVRTSLYQLREEPGYKYLFIGTSHGQFGIDPAVIEEETGKKSFNLCMADAYPDDMYYLMKEACRTQMPEKIIYEIDPSYWMLNQRLGSTAIGFYKEFPMSFNKLAYFYEKVMEFDFRSTIFPWSYYKNLMPEIPEHIRIKSTRKFDTHDASLLNNVNTEFRNDGFAYRKRVEGEEKGTYNHVPWNEENLKEKALNYFARTDEFCEENDIELQLVILPVPQETVANTPEAFEAADAYFEQLAKDHELEYYNFNMEEDLPLDRSINGYWDYDGHMYGDQAGEFSKILGNYIQSEGE